MFCPDICIKLGWFTDYLIARILHADVSVDHNDLNTTGTKLWSSRAKECWYDTRALLSFIF